MPDETATFEHFQIARREDGSLFELGRGAMGVTYKAYDTRLDGYVALKVINPGYLNDDVGRERFLREARAAAHLDHPNVAAIFHRGEEGGTYFYAMQFIEGETLDAYVRRRGPLPVALALRLVLQAAQGLAAANARGLIHRDIKPANLMLVHLDDSGLAASAAARTGNLDGDGEDLLVKVIDFGLAKVVLDDKAGASLSLTGDGPIGTPYYMSPEQIDSSIGEVDARTDIYSLGVTLWYLLTGQPPFVGTQFQVFRQHIGAPPPTAQLPVAVPDSVRGLLDRMMAKTPTDRPANTRELIGLVRELLRGPLVPATADGPVASPPVVLVASPPPPVPPPWTPPPATHAGQTLADTSRPPSLPPALPVGAPVAFNRPPTLGPLPPPGVYVAPRRAGLSREWIIFGIVLLAALVLGGVPLALYLSKSGSDRHLDNGTPALASATPVATPAPSAGSMWKSVGTPAATATPTFTVPPPAGPRILSVPGQYATVQAAIDAARSGETVKVGPGTFHEKLVFKPGIRLVGGGVGVTTISVAGTTDCLDVKDCASGTISGFTFEHTAANPPNDVEYVVWLHGSAVQVRDCLIRNSGSFGLSCEDGDRSVVEDCEIVGSHTVGLRAKGAGTQPVFRGNRVHGGAGTGIVFNDGAAGLAENNTSEDNAQFGFSILDKGTAPALSGNTVRRNKLSGFTYQKEAGGSATNNIVTDNTEAGFRIADAGTTPALFHNQVKGNGLSGFIILEGGGGLLDTNTSDANSGSGVMIRSAGCAPTLKNNRLTGNKLNGLYVGDGAVPTAESNTVTGNVQSGVFIIDKNTAPTLRGNQVRDNGYDGITVRGGAAGVLEGNVCGGNQQHGIGVYDVGTSPTLVGNQTENNLKENLFVEKGATPKKSAKYDGFFK